MFGEIWQKCVLSLSYLYMTNTTRVCAFVCSVCQCVCYIIMSVRDCNVYVCVRYIVMSVCDLCACVL